VNLLILVRFYDLKKKKLFFWDEKKKKKEKNCQENFIFEICRVK